MKLKPLFLVIALILLSGCVQKEMPEPGAPEDEGSEGWRPDGVVEEGEYFGSTTFYGPESHGYSGGDLEVFWTCDDEYLYMALRGETTGWISIGFDPLEWMKDADVIMGSVDGKVVIVEDQYSTESYGPHLPDGDLGGTDDILEYGGREKDGRTVIEFKRRLDTGDEFDKVITPSQELSVIWSMSDSGNLQGSHNVARADGRLRLGEEAKSAPEAAAALTMDERDGILFIHEEERMAEDLYKVLYKKAKLPIFLNVAASEQIHMDSVQVLMDRYGLEGPMPEEDGIFDNKTLQKMYGDLLASGEKSPEDALRAAALVEETSVHDLEKEISKTEKPDIRSIYEGLLAGSEKHLRSFTRALKELGVEYSPQVLSREEYDEIVKA